MTKFIYDEKYPFYNEHMLEVGGKPEIGLIQFSFLRNEGLKNTDVILDIACGCLRGGKYFIDFLNKSNYLGIEMQERLLQSVLQDDKHVHKLYVEKKPELIISDRFEFNLFTKIPNIAIAQSLFTHLTKIEKCLANLYIFSSPDIKFYATFNGDIKTQII